MQALAEFAPLLAFAIAYYLRGLYTATAVLMVAMLILVAVDWLRLKRVPPMHGLSAVLVVVFGSATLLLHNKQFIQWKPTVFFWLASAAFLGSFWIGKRTLTERLLGPTLGAHLRVTPALWRTLNSWWVVFYALLGALNLVVVYYASERVWVALKFVDIVLMLVFVVAQVLWLTARQTRTPGESSA
ncbi:MAG TPA: inner membrane-spanning protein YciB [Steroidobacteraceae bacterium]|jgi:intracellular septation protein